MQTKFSQPECSKPEQRKFYAGATRAMLYVQSQSVDPNVRQRRKLFRFHENVREIFFNIPYDTACTKLDILYIELTTNSIFLRPDKKVCESEVESLHKHIKKVSSLIVRQTEAYHS